MKLVIREPETAALEGWLAARPAWASSALVRVEVLRAVRRSTPALAALGVSLGDAQLLLKARDVLEAVNLIRVDEAVLDRAGRLDPPALRALDAIHLATALALEQLETFVTYDAQLAEAARSAGLTVFAPRA